jgi:hypothetical protein
MPLGDRRLGLLIGYDIEFPEAAMALALAGCDTLLVLGGVSDRDALPLLPARARDSGCWLAYAGPGAQVLDPSGRPVAARPAADGLVVAELGPPAPPLGTAVSTGAPGCTRYSLMVEMTLAAPPDRAVVAQRCCSAIGSCRGRRAARRPRP